MLGLASWAMMDELLTTRKAAEMLGVGTTSIKRWADTGVLPCIKTAGGHRRFPRSACEELLRRPPVPGLEPSSDRVAGWVEMLVERTDANEVRALLASERDDLGSWWDVAEAMGPVLEEIGRRWNLGGISVLQEHLASERLRRALADAAEKLPIAESAPTALLLAAEGEEHTLGLSLVELCLRSSGWRCRWTGRNTPFADVRRFVASGGVRLVALSASISSTNQALLVEQAECFGALCREHAVELVLGGRGRWPEHPKWGVRVRTFEELRRAIETD